MKTMKVNALIVEDDKESRDLLCLYLKQHGGFSEIVEACSAEDALFKLMETLPDIVFLDIQLPGKSGIDFLGLLNRQSIRTHFVIVSSSRNFAVDAIKFDVFDYILKPINKAELFNVIDRFRLKIITNPGKKLQHVIKGQGDEVKIKFNSRSSYVIVEPKDIVYCQADGAYTSVYFSNGKKELVSTYLTKVEEVLLKFNFVRISRSTLINVNWLRSVNRSNDTCCLMVEGKEFIIQGAKLQLKDLCNMDF
jgi:DNA-binding LytR/AlgR family response regulator